MNTIEQNLEIIEALNFYKKPVTTLQIKEFVEMMYNRNYTDIQITSILIKLRWRGIINYSTKITKDNKLYGYYSINRKR